MKENDKGISIILPTLNERKNLEKLIPDFIDNLEKNYIKNYEILVIDDRSTDNTKEYVDSLTKINSKIKLIVREKYRSLPQSILDGINHSIFEYVIWLDADLSMPAKDSLKLIKEFFNKDYEVVIGSRFTNGGGYKGVKDISNNSLMFAIKNVYKSNDSVIGMLFSIFFNKILNLLLKIEIKDITSGFIVLPKNLINSKVFTMSNYGEYFIYLVNDLTKKGVHIKEIGYICETRLHGESKTASSFLQLIKRGIPYIKAALKCRIYKYENIR